MVDGSYIPSYKHGFITVFNSSMIHCNDIPKNATKADNKKIEAVLNTIIANPDLLRNIYFIKYL